jgi:hypothetical protein
VHYDKVIYWLFFKVVQVLVYKGALSSLLGAVPTSFEKSGILDSRIQPPPWHIFEGALLPQRSLGIHLPKTQSRNLKKKNFGQLNAAFFHFILLGIPVRILMILYITQVVDGIRSGVKTKKLRWRVECA